MRSFHNISNRKFASEPSLWTVASFLVCIQIHILFYCHVLQCQWIIGLNATIKCLICVASLSHFRLFLWELLSKQTFFPVVLLSCPSSKSMRVAYRWKMSVLEISWVGKTQVATEMMTSGNLNEWKIRKVLSEKILLLHVAK